MIHRNRAVTYTPILVLAIITLVGAFLRLYGLTTQSLDNDELSSWARSNYATFAEVVAYGARYDGHPPGYYFLLSLVLKYIGDSETILRLPSAIAGTLAIPAIFLLGRRLYSPREGLIAAALVAILWFPLYYSQTARAYALVLLFSIVSTYFWLDIVFERTIRLSRFAWSAFAYILAAVTLSYLHYFGTCLVALQGLGAAIMLLVTRRKAHIVFGVVGIYLIVALAYLPWVPFMLEQFSFEDRLFPVLRNGLTTSESLPGQLDAGVTAVDGEVESASGEAKSQGKSIVRESEVSFYQFLIDYYFFLYNRSRGMGLMALALYGTSLLVVVASRWRAITFLQKPSFGWADVVLVAWLFLPILVTSLLSIASQPLLTERYLIVSVPAAYLLLARAITLLPIARKGHTLVAIAFVGLSLYHLVFRIEYYSRPYKTQFREAAAYVAAHEDQYSNALLIGFAHSPKYFDYYLEQMNATQRVELIAGREEDIAVVDELLSAKQPAYVWYITAHREPEAEFLDYLHQRLSEIDHESLKKANTWLFMGQ